jgi:hypothetical protein
VELVADLFAVLSGISGSIVLRLIVGKALAEEDVRKWVPPIPISRGVVGFYISGFSFKGRSRGFLRSDEAV